MKVSVIRTRVRGVLLPKGGWSREPTYDGDLSIATTRDNRLNRLSKTARLLHEDGKTARMELLDVSLEWVNDERLVLTGFESYVEDGKTTDYAQSWLCLIGEGRRLRTESQEYEARQARQGSAFKVPDVFPPGR